MKNLMEFIETEDTTLVGMILGKIWFEIHFMERFMYLIYLKNIVLFSPLTKFFFKFFEWLSIVTTCLGRVF